MLSAVFSVVNDVSLLYFTPFTPVTDGQLGWQVSGRWRITFIRASISAGLNKEVVRTRSGSGTIT